jgi:hypothetical protein
VPGQADPQHLGLNREVKKGQSSPIYAPLFASILERDAQKLNHDDD